jgi:hypothetical protein
VDKKLIQHDFGHGTKIGKELRHPHHHEDKKESKYDDLAATLVAQEKERKAHKHDNHPHHPAGSVGMAH